MSASANIVSFLLIESCRLEPFPKGTILLATEVLKISIVTIFADPNDMWREWKIKFLNVVDTHALYEQSGSVKKDPKRITSELKKHMHEREIMK